MLFFVHMLSVGLSVVNDYGTRHPAAPMHHHTSVAVSDLIERTSTSRHSSRSQTADPLLMRQRVPDVGSPVIMSASLTYITHRHACLALTPSTMSLAVLSFASMP